MLDVVQMSKLPDKSKWKWTYGGMGVTKLSKESTKKNLKSLIQIGTQGQKMKEDRYGYGKAIERFLKRLKDMIAEEKEKGAEAPPLPNPRKD